MVKQILDITIINTIIPLSPSALNYSCVAKSNPSHSMKLQVLYGLCDLLSTVEWNEKGRTCVRVKNKSLDTTWDSRKEVGVGVRCLASWPPAPPPHPGPPTPPPPNNLSISALLRRTTPLPGDFPTDFASSSVFIHSLASSLLSSRFSSFSFWVLSDSPVSIFSCADSTSSWDSCASSFSVVVLSGCTVDSSSFVLGASGASFVPVLALTKKKDDVTCRYHLLTCINWL